MLTAGLDRSGLVVIIHAFFFVLVVEEGMVEG
jgi:hypothetical protein